MVKALAITATLKCKHIDNHYGHFFLLLVGVMYMAYSSSSTHIWCDVCMYVWTYAKPMCVQFVYYMSDNIFNLSAGVITDHSKERRT